MKMDAAKEAYLSALAARTSHTPIERHCAVVSDLFEPAPQQWGLRGDPVLWAEMRQALSHVSLPEQPDAIAPIVRSAFLSITGRALDARSKIRVPRFARGGMSSGIVSGEFWAETVIPLLRNRTQWLIESWEDR